MHVKEISNLVLADPPTGHVGFDRRVAAASPAPRPPSGATVLLVDDEPAIRRLIVRILQRLGYAVIEAGDGDTALSLVEAGGRIDLLLTDVGLTPSMNGLQLAGAARALRPTLKVVFITGSRESVPVHAFCAAGDIAVISKPFEMAAFSSKIATLIAGPRTL